MSAPSDEADRRLGSFRVFSDHYQRIDSAVTLFALVQMLATDASIVVDVGCGRGAMIDPEDHERPLHDMRAAGRTVIGIDVDPAGSENPIIDEFRVIDDGRWPLEDGSADLAYCDWVLEHIQEPEQFVAELHRVLRPGGAFIARTVSRSSLLSQFARLVPNERHSPILTRLQPGRRERDVFPTCYRMNTRRDIKAVFDSGFDWTVSFHPGMEQYAMRWPWLQRSVSVVESRIPSRAQLVMIVSARKR